MKAVQIVAFGKPTEVLQIADVPDVGAPGPNTNMRGVPDIAYQASSRTGVLVYLTEPYPPGATSTGCRGSNPCQTGWYVVGGTSASSPQWAGLIAMADQIAGRDLGFINPALYTIASDQTKYANDFYDVTVGSTTRAPPARAATARFRAFRLCWPRR